MARFSYLFALLLSASLASCLAVAATPPANPSGNNGAMLKAAPQAVRQATRVAELRAFAAEKRQQAERKREQASAKAKRLGWPIRRDSGRSTMELKELASSGMPVYYTTQNEDAAVSTRADRLWLSPYNVTGQGYTIGEWDGGGVLTGHQEFGGRVTQIDSPESANDHATHVAGTLIGGGAYTSAKGMAYRANLHAHDWHYDTSEMATAASGGLEISNHSYGLITGWSLSSDGYSWYGDTSISNVEDYKFGFYSQDSQEWDQIAYDAPYYLIVKAAGNDRGDSGPPTGEQYWVYDPGSGDWTKSSLSRDLDGGTSGYDSISGYALAKNILTVGAVYDVPSYSSASDVTMSSFSGWGPADDGRIKPDLVGNGISLLSSLSDASDSYGNMSGTSMASPNVTGTLALVQQYYKSLHNGTPMRAATLKGLAIHTAREAGAYPGPDYRFGWGLLNGEAAASLVSDQAAGTGCQQIHEMPLNNGSSVSIPLNMLSGETSLKATLAWRDPPGTPVNASLDPSNPMLVNDLDLRISNDSTTYYPWVLNPSSPDSGASTGDNSLDNIEQVVVTSPSAGNYTLQVSHKGSLRNGQAQPFSLIISTDQKACGEGGGDSDDNYEENDTLQDAYDLSSQNQTWLNSLSGLGVQRDDDWYRIHAAAGYERIQVNLQFTHANGDINLGLYNASGTLLAAATSTTDNEALDHTLSSSGDYYLKVYNANNGNSYNLWWDDQAPQYTGPDDPYEENDTLESAMDISGYPQTYLSTIDGYGIQGDDDWYQIHAPPGSERIMIQLNFHHSLGDIDLALYTAAGELLATSTSVTDFESIDHVVPSSGSYFIKVYYGNNGNTYDLQWASSTPITDDQYEENDTQPFAHDLTYDESTWLSELNGPGIQRDDDWYKIYATPGYERIQVELSFTHAEGDIDLALYDEAGNMLASSVSFTDNEAIDFTVDASDADYFVRVYGYQSESGSSYDLRWFGGAPVHHGPDDAYEENDDFSSAHDLSNSGGVWLSGLEGAGIQSDNDWYKISVSAQSTLLQVELTFTHAEGDIDLALYDAGENLLADSTSVNDNENIELSLPQTAANYYLKVYYGDAGNRYDLMWTENDGNQTGDQCQQGAITLSGSYDGERTFSSESEITTSGTVTFEASSATTLNAPSISLKANTRIKPEAQFQATAASVTCQ